jgi:uncharacterized protein YjbI with pentapeptide repeats
METIEIKKRFNGNVIFSHTCENNTIKITVEQAVKSGAYLRDADLTGADLTGADLTGAYLTGAYLTDANLTGACIPIHCKWGVSIIDGNIKIGCKIKSIEEWDTFFASDEEFSTARNTDDFIRIRAMYEAYKSYINVINTK